MSQSAKQKERDEAIERLREWIKPGDTVYTILRHVSRSGMQREVSLKLFKDRELPYHLDGNVAAALGNRIGKHDGVIVSGCGMDVGFELVYNLGRVLFPGGVSAQCTRCNLYPVHHEDDGKVIPNRDGNGDLYAYGPCSGWNRDTEPEGEFLGHSFRGRNGDRGPWEPDGGYALQQRWL